MTLKGQIQISVEIYCFACKIRVLFLFQNYYACCKLQGSVDAASELPLLEEICVTHILDATSMSLEYFPGRFILDLPQADIISGLDDCFSFIDEAVKNNGKVLVHCMAGISRSSSIVIGYLMKSNNMSFEEALEHVKTQRPATNPNSGFRDQLKRYSPLKNISDTADADT